MAATEKYLVDGKGERIGVLLEFDWASILKHDLS